MNTLLRLAAGTAVVATSFAISSVAEAHANTVTCVDQTTSTWRITNDYPLTETFTSPQGPSGSVAAGNGSFTDVVYNGDSLQIDAVWSDGFTESRTGTGDCTPEIIVTTTTELVTTTAEQETTTSTTIGTTIPSSSTSEPTTTVVETSTSTLPTTTSSSVATTSTSSPEPTTSTTAPATSSTTLPVVSSTTPECSDNPNTPTDECGPSLPATGSDSTGYVVGIALGCILLGALTLHFNRRTL